MVVSETNTLFPLITTHAQISALPQIVAPHQGQNDKYAHPPISAPIPHPSPLTPHPSPPTPHPSPTSLSSTNFWECKKKPACIASI